MNDVTDVICTLLLCKYPSIDAVYEYFVPCVEYLTGGAGPEKRGEPPLLLSGSEPTGIDTLRCVGWMRMT